MAKIDKFGILQVILTAFAIVGAIVAGVGVSKGNLYSGDAENQPNTALAIFIFIPVAILVASILEFPLLFLFTAGMFLYNGPQESDRVRRLDAHRNSTTGDEEKYAKMMEGGLFISIFMASLSFFLGLLNHTLVPRGGSKGLSSILGMVAAVVIVVGCCVIWKVVAEQDAAQYALLQSVRQGLIDSIFAMCAGFFGIFIMLRGRTPVPLGGCLTLAGLTAALGLRRAVANHLEDNIGVSDTDSDYLTAGYSLFFVGGLVLGGMLTMVSEKNEESIKANFSQFKNKLIFIFDVLAWFLCVVGMIVWVVGAEDDGSSAEDLHEEHTHIALNVFNTLGMLIATYIGQQYFFLFNLAMWADYAPSLLQLARTYYDTYDSNQDNDAFKKMAAGMGVSIVGSSFVVLFSLWGSFKLQRTCGLFSMLCAVAMVPVGVGCALLWDLARENSGRTTELQASILFMILLVTGLWSSQCESLVLLGWTTLYAGYITAIALLTASNAHANSSSDDDDQSAGGFALVFIGALAFGVFINLAKKGVVKAESGDDGSKV